VTTSKRRSAARFDSTLLAAAVNGAFRGSGVPPRRMRGGWRACALYGLLQLNATDEGSGITKHTLVAWLEVLPRTIRTHTSHWRGVCP
jgi:hypothetical protein